MVELRRAIGEGRLDEARALHAQLVQNDGVEITLLGARVAALGGDDEEASRLVERARALAPTDARVYATAAEIHAAAGRMETADEEIRRGVEACGPNPELERSRGVYLICVPGGAEAGLGLLETALAHDPGLPFVARPLGQAHLLVAKEDARGNDLAAALEHAKQSIAHDPEDVDARRFLAEMMVNALDFGGAITIYEALLEEHVPVEIEASQAYKNGAVAALAMGARDQAVVMFLRARTLGMDDDALGSGVGVLRDEARAEAVAALDREDAKLPEERDAHIEKALVLDANIGEDLVVRAVHALDREKYGDAKSLARQALFFLTNDPRALALPELAAAREAVASQDLPSAQGIVREALERNPGNVYLAAEHAWLMAVEAQSAGEIDHALELAGAALTHDPDHTRAHELCAGLFVERGLAALEAHDYAGAIEPLKAAIDHDPSRIEAHQFLGLALFETGDAAGAARAFDAVLAIARSEDLELPDPVHIQLARALFLAGDAARARETLEDYLVAHPGGAFVDQTREVLDALPAPEPPGAPVEDAGDGG
jgi:tetratricopeptide (TPR) repeat protein